MQFPLFRLKEGPDWAQSVEEADPGDDRFRDNLEALRLALEYGAWAYSQPLTGAHDATRIATTKDTAAGYRLVAGIRIDGSTVVLGWVDLEKL